jgi:hypothetical protein
MKTLFKFFLLSVFFIYPLQAQNGGHALQFNGTDNYVSVPDNASLDFTQFTIEMWVYISASGSSFDYKLIGQTNADNASQGYLFGVRDNKLCLEVWHGASPSTNVLSSEDVPLNKWVHLAMSWKAGDYLKGYINGKQVINTATFNADITNTTPVIIGMAPWYNLHEKYFKGYMDEIRIWNVVRTEEEIRANMYKELAGNESNLAAYYKMSNGSGTTLTDNQAGGINNGTINGASWTASGAFTGSGKALQFDGVDDYVDCAANDASLENFNNLTMEAWVKITAINTDLKIVGKSYTISDAFYILGIYNGKIYPEIRINSSTYISFTAGTISSDKWTHLAVTFSKGNGGNNGTFRGYINGVLVYEKTDVPDAGISITGGNPLRIGAAPWDATSNKATGQIDEVRIWNTARTQEEIRENMMTTLSGNETGLVAYYRFDQADGSTLYDMSSYGHNGTLHGLPSWVTSSAFNTWIGSESTDWSASANWSSGSVPAATDNVGLYKWNSGNESTISGTPAVNNLLFSSTASPILSSNFTVNGNLFLNKNVDLNGQTITLGSSGYLYEGNYRLYGTSGTITTTRNLNNISAENVGGLGAVLTTAANMGSTTITRGHAVHTSGPAKSISRYYSITPSTNTGLNATLVFNYNDNEFNGISENNFVLFKSTDSGTNWTDAGGTLDAANNKMTLTGINDFSLWTIGDFTSPLPVELTTFTAKVNGSKVVLNWQTATEINNYGFEVQRSVDNGKHTKVWEKIGLINGNGNSNSPKDYSFTDEHPKYGAASYRLKQIDNDGKYEFSKTVEVDVQGRPKDFSLAQNYPNPFNPATLINYQVPSSSYVTLKVYNILGKEVLTLVDEEKNSGHYQVKLDGNGLASGIYFYTLRAGSFVQTRQCLLLK